MTITILLLVALGAAVYVGATVGGWVTVALKLCFTLSFGALFLLAPHSTSFAVIRGSVAVAAAVTLFGLGVIYQRTLSRWELLCPHPDGYWLSRLSTPAFYVLVFALPAGVALFGATLLEGWLESRGVGDDWVLLIAFVAFLVLLLALVVALSKLYPWFSGWAWKAEAWSRYSERLTPFELDLVVEAGRERGPDVAFEAGGLGVLIDDLNRAGLGHEVEELAFQMRVARRQEIESDEYRWGPENP